MNTNSTAPFAIRDVQPSDAEAIVGILNPIIEARVYTALDTPFTVAAERDFIADFPRRGIFKVAVRAGDQQLVGFQNMEPFANYTHAFDHVGVLSTYVDLNVRRQGVAKQLFTATFAGALAKGYEKIFTFVRADNPAALQTYLAHGFVIVGTAKRQAKIDGHYVDEIIIERHLIAVDMSTTTHTESSHSLPSIDKSTDAATDSTPGS